MSEPRQPNPHTPDESLSEAMAAHLFGEASPEQRHRLDLTLSRSPRDKSHWDELTAFFDDLAHTPLPEAAPDFEQEMFARLQRRTELDPVATVEMTQGVVRHVRHRQESWSPIGAGDALRHGDALEIESGGRALVRLPDKSELWINGGSLLRIGRRKAGSVVRLVRGEILALMEKQQREFSIITSDGAVAVMGTVFDTESQPSGGTRVLVLEGRVAVTAGLNRRSVSAGRGVKLQGGGSLSRTRRLSQTELQRLQGWTSTLREASRAGDRKTVVSSRRGSAGGWMLRAVALVALVLIGFAGYNHFFGSTPSPSALGDATNQAPAPQRDVTAAVPIEVTEPVRLATLPRPGDRWTQSTHLTGTILTQRTTSPDERERIDCLIQSESVAQAGEASGELIVTHRVTRATLESVDLVPSDRTAGELEEAGREVQELDPVTMIEHFNAGGVRTDVEMLGLDTEEIQARMLVPHILKAQTMATARPVTVGDSWSFRIPANEFTVADTDLDASLIGFEELAGDQFAVVQAQARQHLTGPQSFDNEPSLARYPGSQLTMTSYDMAWNGQSRHRLIDGRLASVRGQMQQLFVFAVEIPGVHGQGSRPYRGTIRYQAAINVEATLNHLGDSTAE
jgi:ferric-dicitrate binding protein FerR (iron transport regulator)